MKTWTGLLETGVWLSYKYFTFSLVPFFKASSVKPQDKCMTLHNSKEITTSERRDFADGNQWWKIDYKIESTSEFVVYIRCIYCAPEIIRIQIGISAEVGDLSPPSITDWGHLLVYISSSSSSNYSVANTNATWFTGASLLGATSLTINTPELQISTGRSWELEAMHVWAAKEPKRRWILGRAQGPAVTFWRAATAATSVLSIRRYLCRSLAFTSCSCCLGEKTAPQQRVQGLFHMSWTIIPDFQCKPSFTCGLIPKHPTSLLLFFLITLVTFFLSLLHLFRPLGHRSFSIVTFR